MDSFTLTLYICKVGPLDLIMSLCEGVESNSLSTQHIFLLYVWTSIGDLCGKY